MLELKLVTAIKNDRVRVHGVAKRIKFLKDQSKKGSKGGKAKAENAKQLRLALAAANAIAPATADATGDALPYTLALSPDQSPDQSDARASLPRAREANPETGWTVEAIARTLWIRQGNIRLDLIGTHGLAGSASLLSAIPTDLELKACGLIAAVVQCGKGDEAMAKLDHCLDIRRAEALRDHSLQWLNGTSNWQPASVTWALGMSVADVSRSSSIPDKSGAVTPDDLAELAERARQEE